MSFHYHGALPKMTFHRIPLSYLLWFYNQKFHLYQRPTRFHWEKFQKFQVMNKLEFNLKNHFIHNFDEYQSISINVYNVKKIWATSSQSNQILKIFTLLLECCHIHKSLCTASNSLHCKSSIKNIQKIHTRQKVTKSNLLDEWDVDSGW